MIQKAGVRRIVDLAVGRYEIRRRGLWHDLDRPTVVEVQAIRLTTRGLGSKPHLPLLLVGDVGPANRPMGGDSRQGEKSIVPPQPVEGWI